MYERVSPEFRISEPPIFSFEANTPIEIERMA